MKLREPPKLATRMLLRLSCHPDNDAILGDLYERYQVRQSAAWYWRQAVIAILTGVIRETWRHKLHSILALTVGWSTLGLIWIVLEGLTAPQFAWHRHACTFLWCIAGIGSGATVGLVTPHRKRPMIFLYASSVALFLLVLHRAPTHALYWIDTIALTISIVLAAVPYAFPAHQSITPAEENM